MSVPKSILPLVVAKDVEPKNDFTGIETPYLLALYIASLLGVDSAQLNAFQELYYGSDQPTGDDTGKVWIKQDSPPGIGIRVGTTYQFLYQYPPNIPLLWTVASDQLPSYMRRLTDDEMTQYNLPVPVNGFYVIFEI